MTSECTHRPSCPGCPHFGQPGVPAEVLEPLDQLCQEAEIERATLLEGPALGFRHRARLSVRGRTNTPKVGIFQLGSHQLVDIPRCPIHHPLINQVAQALRKAIRSRGTQPYIESSHRGILKAVQIAVERPSQSAQVVLVTTNETAEPIRELAVALQEELGEQLHSLWWNGNPQRTNSYLGPHWEKLSGPDALLDTVGNTSIYYPPDAFGQNHLALAERIVDEIQSWVPKDRRVAEFYAGVGAIGLGLVQDARSIVFNEVSQGGLAGLRMGLDALMAEAEPSKTKVRVLEGPADKALQGLVDAEIVIADPPRKGLDLPFIEALRAHPPERFIYAACGLESFLRDTRRLIADHCFELKQLRPIALFPYTEHVETLALFEPSTRSSAS
ncbi:MAG: class I SAM-dependent RNA methyltransferase [Deltaproteobacteria bacterium]|nr:class I SAM-dependent RNA methyltransferase [Deltaproteobacteria bacterium]